MYHGVSLIYCDLTEIRHFVFGMPENKYREEYSEYRSGNEIFVVHSFHFFIFAFSFDRKRKRDSDEYDVYDSSSDSQESKCCEKTIRINRLDILLTCLLGLVIILSVTLGVVFGIDSNKEEISDEFRYDFILIYKFYYIIFHLFFIIYSCFEN